MKKMKNDVHIEGYVYDSNLEKRVTGDTSKNPGTEYIRGKLKVATDEECVNIVTIDYTYVIETFKSGTKNASFEVLNGIIDGKHKTVLSSSKDEAAKVRIDTNISLNDFYTNRNGEMELVSAKQFNGGFIHITNAIDADESKRNRFEVDMVITGTRKIEENPEKNLPEKLVIKGAIFDFRNALLPVEFSVINPRAIAYFEGLEPSSSNPTFTKVWGKQISEVVVTKYVEESAFGEDYVREVESSRKDWVITGAIRDPYDWDDEGTITAEELKKAIADREIYLATVKQRQEEYNASKGQMPAAVTPSKGDFNF